MLILTLALLFALAFLVVLLVSRPLFEAQTDSPPPTRQSALQAERERLLSALQELDFDRGLDKMSAEVYAAQRAALLEEAVAVEKQLQAVSPLPQDTASQK